MLDQVCSHSDASGAMTLTPLAWIFGPATFSQATISFAVKSVVG